MTTRRTVAAAIGVSAIMALPTAAHADPAPKKLQKPYLKAYAKADKAGAEPGRNIVEDGVRKHGDTRAATEREVRRSLGVLQRMLAPAPAPAATGGSLDAIAACESGGDPSAVDASGTYRGKYQFDQRTWQSVGGSGDPAAASEAEQDARAQALIAQRGASPWPVCGA